MGVRRERREWESEYAAEAVMKLYPKHSKYYHIRIGNYPPELKAETLEDMEQRMLRVYLRWADAIAVNQEEVVVVETKLRPTEYLKGLGELELYTRLLPASDEWKRICEGKKIVGHLVISVDDPPIENLARQKGFRVTVLQPSFWSEYIAHLPKRTFRPPLVTFPPSSEG
jgi:hypothetical protein